MPVYPTCMSKSSYRHPNDRIILSSTRAICSATNTPTTPEAIVTGDSGASGGPVGIPAAYWLLRHGCRPQTQQNMVLSQRNQYFLPKPNDKHQHHELSAIPPWILPLCLLSPMTYDMEKGCAGTSQPPPLGGGGNSLVICHTLCPFSGSPLR